MLKNYKINTNLFPVASLVLGIASIPLSRIIIVPALAIILGIVAIKDKKGVFKPVIGIMLALPMLVTGIVDISGGYESKSQVAPVESTANKPAATRNPNDGGKNASDSQQSEIDQLKEEIDALKRQEPQSIIKNKTKPEMNLATIINEWKPRIAHIECDFYNKAGELTARKAGSGTFVNTVSKSIIVTNRHVISNKDIFNVGPLGACYIKFPDDDKIFKATKDDINWDNSPSYYDIGYIEIDLNDNLKSLPLVNYCAIRPSVGDAVIILGYPAIGATSDITATEGIISGFDGDYYITSAKVEHGNSGGAAILVRPEGNCYLGIPSYVLSGEIESLARILDYRVKSRYAE